MLARRRATDAYCVGGSAFSSIVSPYARPHACAEASKAGSSAGNLPNGSCGRLATALEIAVLSPQIVVFDLV